jgi:hypothetical protein
MPLLTLKDVETEHHVKRDKVARLVRLGIIPAGVAVRLGRRVLIDQEAFEEFIRAGGRGLDTRRESAADGGAL